MAACALRSEHWTNLAQQERGAVVSVATNAHTTLLISAQGYEQRCGELDSLRTEARRDLVDRLREAREDGDIGDNPALQDLLEEQAQLEWRIAVLEAQLANAEIVPPSEDERAGLGSVVTVRDGNDASVEYELVGPLESDAGNGLVSIEAPVGRALLGQRAGARVKVKTPRGRFALEVMSVRPRNLTARKAA
jgi:transcription elongation factor GreA